MRDLLVGCLGLAVGLFMGVIAAAAFFAYFVIGNSPVPTPVASTNQPDVTISANAAFVSAQMQDAIRQSGISKQATVSPLAPNLIQITTMVNVPLAGQTIPINATATMSVAVKNGRAVLATEKLSVAGVTAPSSLVTQSTERLRALGEDEINRLVQRGLQGTGLHLVNVRMSSEAVMIDLSSR